MGGRDRRRDRDRLRLPLDPRGHARGARRGGRASAAGAASDEPDEDYTEGPAVYTRSVFLEASTLGIGALIGGIVTLPVWAAVLPAFVDQEYEPVDVGPVENFPEGQWVVTKFVSRQDQPEDVSRRTAYIRNNGEQDGQPSFTIISNRCVHLGCPVQPTGLTEDPREVETEAGIVEVAATNPSGFACPCHGGAACDTEGNRVAGPPVRSLVGTSTQSRLQPRLADALQRRLRRGRGPRRSYTLLDLRPGHSRGRAGAVLWHLDG